MSYFEKGSCIFGCSLDDTIGDYYYFNVDTGETQWAHPLDEIYRQKVILARNAFTEKQNVVEQQSPGDKDVNLKTGSGGENALLDLEAMDKQMKLVRNIYWIALELALFPHFGQHFRCDSL